MQRILAAVALLVAPVCVRAALVEDVQALVEHGQFATAEREVQAARAKAGASSELAAAISWLARGALAARQFSQADAYATEAREMALPLLGMRRIESDPWLPTAVGAAIEVHAFVLAAQGEIPESLRYLQQQLKTWGATSLHERISKDINLLTLEGKPAPPLQGISLASLRGKAVLLFFWAHWCPDCKADVPIIADVTRKFAPKGLVLVGPTRLYGYVANGDSAPPAVEKQYIEQVRRKYYEPLGSFPEPISAENFQKYGASTTPTIVLLDRAGVVRYYHPGAVTEAELSARVEAVLR